MGIWFCYDVIQHYNGEDAPEPFGTITLRTVPNINDIIMLKWLSGEDAYKVKIDSIEGNILHVTGVKEHK